MSTHAIRQSILSLVLGLFCSGFLHAQVSVNVKDFGAIGDGKADDAPAFVKAIDKVRKQDGKPVTLLIPKGTYRLGIFHADNPSDQGGNLTLSNLSNVTVQGENQPLLLMGNPFREGLFVTDCTAVTIRNLTIDYDPFCQTQGTIVAVNPEGNFIDMKITPGFPLPTDSWIDSNVASKTVPTKNIGYIFDPRTGRKLNQFYDQYFWKNQSTLIGDGVYRLKSTNPVESEMVGMTFTVVSRRKANAVKVHRTMGCQIENVTVYHAPACGFHLTESKDVIIDHSAITRKPDSGRMMTTNADGLHVKWCLNGPVLSNSSFTGMGDDSVNIGGSYAPVVDQPNDHTMIVKAHSTVNHVDGEYYILDRTTHAHVPLGKVVSVKGTRVDGYKGPCLQLTFENKLPALITMLQIKDQDKAEYRCSQLINYDYVGQGGKVLNCHFYDHRLRGVLMRCPDGVIKGNHFENLAGPAIVVSNDGGFIHEGPSGDGTIIEDNTFTNIERSNIWINSGAGEQSDKATLGIRNVIIRSNTFESYGGANIYGRGEVGNLFFIHNASDLIIENNVIGKPSSPTYAGEHVLLQHIGKITWQNNTIDSKPLIVPDTTTKAQ